MLLFARAGHFPIKESTALLFRVEFFNIFNHPQFVVPAAVINSLEVLGRLLLHRIQHARYRLRLD